MKPLVGKIIISDRHILTVAVSAFLIIIYMFIVFISSSNLKRENRKLKNQLHEIKTFTEEIIYIKDSVESREKKIGLTEVSGVVSVLEQMLSSLGLEAKVIKPLEKKRIKEYSEENAELQIEDIDLNKIVNLFYEIENSPVPVKIKNVIMKTTFENPDIFILSLTASLISK